MDLISEALKSGRTTLNEYESKKVLSSYGIPVTREMLVDSGRDLAKAVEEIGFPLVMKVCSDLIAHKTEKGLIFVDVRSLEEAEACFDRIMSGLEGAPGGALVQEMVRGKRELAAGLTRDPQFGPCVMFGLGGIFTEILRDVSFRLAPLAKPDALDMMTEIKGVKILRAVRGMEAVDTDQLAETLINLGRIGLENEAVKEIDINPLIIVGDRAVAVDALMVLEEG